MDFLNGKKTYITAAATIVVAGLSMVLGEPVLGVDPGAASEMIFGAFAVLFLRRGVEKNS